MRERIEKLERKIKELYCYLQSNLFEPSSHDLNEFLNEGTDPFVNESDLEGFVPLSGTVEPITGDLEFDTYNIGLKHINQFENKKSKLGFQDGNAILQTTYDDTYISYIQATGTGLEIYCDFPNSVGFTSALDFSETEPENKLVYAQRQYVDNAINESSSSVAIADGEYYDNTDAIASGVTDGQLFILKDYLETKKLAVAKVDVKPFYGILYNKDTWTDTNDFDIFGTASLTVVNGKLRINTGTNGVFTNYVSLKSNTGLYKYKSVVRFKVNDTPTTTSYGLGFGVKGKGVYTKYSLSTRVGLANAANVMYIETGTDNTFVNRFNSTKQLVPTREDIYELIMEHDINRVSIKVTNLSSKQTDEISYNYSMNTIMMPNMGSFSIFAMGGSYDIQSIKIFSKEYKNAKLMCVGDSKTKAYYADNFLTTFPQLLNKTYGGVVNNSGGYDGVDAVLAKIPEIIAMTPVKVLLNIGSNDKRQGMTLANWQTKYASIVSQLTTAGIDVYHLLQFNENSLNFSDYNSFINTSYSSSKIIDAGTIGLNSDGVHPNQAGMTTIYNAIVSKIGSII